MALQYGLKHLHCSTEWIDVCVTNVSVNLFKQCGIISLVHVPLYTLETANS